MVVMLLPVNAWALELEETGHEDHVHEENVSEEIEAEEIIEEHFAEDKAETLNASVVASGYCGKYTTNISWQLDSDGVLTISGSGEMKDYVEDYIYGDGYGIPSTHPWYKYKNQIKKIVFSGSITRIGDGAFYDLSSVYYTVQIPSSVKEIGILAFYGMNCYIYFPTDSSLTYIGAEAFSGSIGGKLEIPETVEYIGPGAFMFSDYEGDLIIPEGITAIEKDTFWGCDGFDGKLVIPESVTTIGSYAFYECSGFSGEVTIPENVKYIGDNAFGDCGFNQYRFEGNVPQILETNGWSYGVFDYEDVVIYNPEKSGWSSLEEVWENAALKTPDDYIESGFCGDYYSPNVKWAVTYGGKLIISGEGAVETYSQKYEYPDGSITGAPWSNYRKQITSLVIEEGITKFGYDVFRGMKYITGELKLPESLTYISGGSFNNCTGLTGDIIIPDGVTWIGGDAFMNCSGFNGKLDLGESVENIADAAFYGCTGLIGEVVIPKTVTRIGNAFQNCSINIYYFEGDTPRVNSSSEGYPSFDLEDTIYYPAGNDTWEIVDGKWNGYTAISWDASVVASGYCGAEDDGTNLNWTLDKDGVLTISGKGKMADYTSMVVNGTMKSSAPWAKYSVKSLVLEYGLTNIGANAFAYCSDLEGTLTIPYSVQTIGEKAFASCTKLSGDLEIPYSVTSIGDSAFGYCYGFKGKLTLSSTLKTIGKMAFRNCDGFIGTLYIPNSVTVIGDNAFANCVGFSALQIGKKVEEIKSYAFFNCSGMEGKTVIPESVTKIGDEAFALCGINEYCFQGNAPQVAGASDDCPSFDSSEDTICYITNSKNWVLYGGRWNGYSAENFMALGNCGNTYAKDVLVWTLTEDGILTISGKGRMDYYGIYVAGVTIYAPWLEYKDSLKTLVIEEGVTNIERYAFENCSGLTGELIIPESVTVIDDYAFKGCSGFTGDLIIPDTVEELGNWVFLECKGFNGELYIGSGLDEIPEWTFRECSMLRGDIVIPDNITVLGEYAFEGCFSFDGKLVIGNSVTSIGELAFSGCSKLKEETTVPESVEYIGKRAFNRCGVENFFFEGDAPFIDETEPSTSPYMVTFDSTDIIYYPAGNNTWEIIDGKWNGYTAVAYGEASNIVASGYCGGEGDGTNLEWAIDSDGVLTISGTGKMADYEGIVESLGDGAFTAYTTAPWYEYCRNIKSVVFEEGITHIGKNAFYEARYIKGDLIIPDSVVSIGENAFRNVTSLDGNLVLGSGLEVIEKSAFNGCINLVGGIYFSENIREIGDEAFFACINLYGTVTIPENVTEIGKETFASCGINEYYFTGNAPSVVAASAKGASFDESADIIYYPAGNYSWVVSGGKWNGYTAVKYGMTVIASGYCGGEGDGTNLRWTIDNEGVLTISGNGKMAGYNYKQTGEADKYITTAPWAEYADSLKALVIKPGVTTIGAYAFRGCSGLSGELVIPEGIKVLGRSSFYECTGFTGDLIIPDSVTYMDLYVFYGCTGFDGKLVISDNVTVIEKSTFCKCLGLSGELVIPHGVTSIGEFAFWGCIGFTGDLVIPDSVKTINNYAFSGCKGFNGKLVIGNGVTDIGKEAFLRCENLTGDLVIPDRVTSIGEFAFYNCIGFEGTLTIGNSVKSIGNSAFSSCSGFTGNLIIPDSVTEIGTEAFISCSGFTGDLIIPDSVTSIGNSAFSRCGGFDGKLVLSNNLTGIEGYTFDNCSGFKGDLIIPDSVTYIGKDAFSHCSGFDGKLVLSNNLTTIGELAFWFCGGLKGDLIIPDSVTSIGFSAFMACTGFDGDLIIGDGVKTIDLDAFIGCSGFKGDLVLGKGITTLQSGIFMNCSGFTNKVIIPSNIRTIKEEVFGNFGSTEFYFVGDAPSVYPASNGWPSFDSAEDTIYYPAGNSTWKVENGKWKGFTAVEWVPCYKSDDYQHDFAEWYVSVEATCMAKGEERRDCANCDHYETREIEVADHTAVIDKAVAPTCTETGLTEGKHCSVCGEVIVAQEVVSALGHTAGAEVVENEVAADCDTDGSYDEVVYCSVCGEELSRETFAVPAKGHDYGEWYVSKEPTYTEKGEERRDCKNCDHYETREVPEKVPEKVDATVTIDSVSIIKGTNKTVSVSISENSNAEMIQFAIEYDSSVLKVVSCSAGSIVSDALINSNEPGIIYFIWEALSPINSAGELLNIEFAVADGAKAQETTVEISNEEELLFVDPSYEELNVEIVNGTVKVIDVLYGDVNGDGKINVIDANLVRKAAAKMITIDENQKLAADVNGDGKINVIDANLIRKYAAKVISAFPVAE